MPLTCSGCFRICILLVFLNAVIVYIGNKSWDLLFSVSSIDFATVDYMSQKIYLQEKQCCGRLLWSSVALYLCFGGIACYVSTQGERKSLITLLKLYVLIVLWLKFWPSDPKIDGSNHIQGILTKWSKTDQICLLSKYVAFYAFFYL